MCTDSIRSHTLLQQESATAEIFYMAAASFAQHNVTRSKIASESSTKGSAAPDLVLGLYTDFSLFGNADTASFPAFFVAGI